MFSETATNQLLDSSNGQSSESQPNISRPGEGTNNDFLDSLTQALLPNTKQSPNIEEKIAGLVNNILTGELSQDSVKERGKKYPPPANCKYLTATMVNEEIWDLLSRKNRSVDLAFQRVQEPLVHGLSSLIINNPSRPAIQRYSERENSGRARNPKTRDGQHCPFWPCKLEA